MLAIAAITLLIFLVVGVPVSFAVGLSGILAIIFGSDIPVLMAVQQMVRGMNSFPMMAGPFFILAGEILGGAKLSERIILFARSLLSWLRGGLGYVCVLANMIFAGISGSGAATMSAIGSLTIPELDKAGYERPFVAALIAGSGSLGPIIPPSVNMIVYGSLTGFSIGKLFIGGLVPGILIGLLLMIWCYFYTRKKNIDPPSNDFNLKELWKRFCDAFFALIIPFIIIGGVTTGAFTATEAGIVACLYGLICGFFIYRTLTLQDLVPIFRRAVSSSAMLIVLMGIANIYSYIFAREGVGDAIKEFLMGVSTNPTVIVLLVIGIMLIIGCFMETVAAMVVILPVIYPVITGLGVDPLLFGVLFSVSTVVGGLTPPVGLYLFLSMNMTRAPFKSVIRYMYPVVGIVLFVMILMMIFPPIVTFLPNLMIQ